MFRLIAVLGILLIVLCLAGIWYLDNQSERKKELQEAKEKTEQKKAEAEKELFEDEGPF